MKLAGKTAIVTGAGSGIGRALALEFARHGARVVCCGRRGTLLDETVARIEGQGGTGLAVPTDVTDQAQVKALVDQTLARFDTIHLLFNNAGSFASIAGVHEVDVDTWWQDVTVNLLGPLCLCRRILPHMLAQNEGIIINMNGGRPVGGTGYACGKAGLMELTRLLAAELRSLQSHVIVLSAGPGLVRTEMTEIQANTEAGRRWIPSTAQAFEAGRIRPPEDIAAATVRMLAVIRPEHSGKAYGPETDFRSF